jgi:hypothetical protein
MSTYATAGEHVTDEAGRVLCTFARDYTSADKRWTADMFSALSFDPNSPKERLPFTAWMVKRILDVQGRA